MRVRTVALAVLVALSGCFSPVQPGSPAAPGASADAPAAAETGESPQSVAEKIRAAIGRFGPGAPRPPPRVVTRGFAPSYDPATVLARVEELRGLNATGRIVVHQYDYRPGPEVNLANRYAGIRPAGAAALALSSNRSVPAPQPLGYTVEQEDGVHVWLLAPEGLRGRNVTQEAVLAHELVHAIQFQHDVLSMSRADLRADFDRWTTDAQLTATAVFEGDATAVMVAYQRRYLDGSVAITPDGFVDERRSWIQSFRLAPYYYGYGFYEAVGAAPADRTRTIRNPPNSTSELLHPGEDRPRPPEVTVPPSAANETYDRMATDTVGELVIRRTLRRNGVPSGRAAVAADGWANGEMGYYRVGDNGTAVRWTTVWRNESEAGEFLDAWRTMLEARNATDEGMLTRLPATNTTPGQFYAIQRTNATVSITASSNASMARGLARALQVSSSWSSANSSSTASSSAESSSASLSPFPSAAGSP